MTEPTKQPRPFDDPDTDEFAVEHDETWIVDQSPETTEEPESQKATQA
jgi:hypothetical protein